MLVIDASAALHAAASVEGFARLQGLEPVAPPLMWSEAISVLHEAVWRGAASRELTWETRARLLSAPIGLRAPAQLLHEAWRIAEELGWAKTYDAEYVALARLLECRLLTADTRLRRGARDLVAVIGPTEL